MKSSGDLVIANGRIVDGCGNPWYRGDVAIAAGSIAAIAPPGTLIGGEVIDAADRYVVPGFIDPHTHSDLSILVHPQAETAVRQGVTTHVTGNCGMAAAPVVSERREEIGLLWDDYGLNHPALSWEWRTFAEYLAEVEQRGTAINIAPLAGHGALRVAVMGYEQREPTAAELEWMSTLLDEALVAGAHGLSTGLVYPPGCYAGTDEIVALCKAVARRGGLYASHVRGERETILPAVGEAIGIGRAAGVPVEVSHNCPKWGAPEPAAANLALIERARSEGHDVTADNDVHAELAPRLSRALPQPLHELSPADLSAALRDPSVRERVRRDVLEDRLPGPGYAGLLRHGAYERIVLLFAPRNGQLVGKSIAAIAAERAADPFDTFLDLIVEEEDRAVGIFDYMDQDDIRTLLTHPLTMCCSDGFVSAPPDEAWTADLYWPCGYSEYPYILQRFVREERALRLEEAIRKMTSFPAQRFHLSDRGCLRPGLRADLAVLDLDRIRDRATNPWPHSAPFVNIPPRYPEGIDVVVVNGVVVLAEGRMRPVLPGMVLRHQA